MILNTLHGGKMEEEQKRVYSRERLLNLTRPNTCRKCSYQPDCAEFFTFCPFTGSDLRVFKHTKTWFPDSLPPKGTLIEIYDMKINVIDNEDK